MELETLLEAIKPVDRTAQKACIDRFDTIAKPIGGLGELETLLARIAAIQGTPDWVIENKCVLVFCADNGVVAEGVAQSGPEVTTNIARMMADRRSSVCVMAEACGAAVFPVDVGMRDTVPGLLPAKLAQGTHNMAHGPAMSRETALEAISIGARLAAQKRTEGFQVMAVGEAGIGNTTTAAAMASLLLNRPVDEVTGKGAGLTPAGLVRKRAVIAQAIAQNRPDPQNPLDLLSKVGGLDIAAMTGAFLGGAATGAAMVVDGVISAVAALCAVRLAPAVREYLLASHCSAEPASSLLCQELGLTPILQANMKLGEGTGAVALFPLLDLGAAVYQQAATFDDLAMEAYERDPC